MLLATWTDEDRAFAEIEERLEMRKADADEIPQT